MDGEQCLKVHICGTLINDHYPVVLKELSKCSGRIYRERRTCNDHEITLLDCLDGIVYVLMLKVLLIKDYIGTYYAAALVTVRHAFLGNHVFCIELLTTVHAIVPEYGTVKLDNALTSRLLMEIIDILGNYRLELTLSLKSYKGFVSLIRLGIRIYQLTLVEIIEDLGMLHKEVMGNDIDGAVLRSALGIVDTGAASEVRNAAFRGNTGTAEEHDVVRFGDQFLKLFELVFPDAAQSVYTGFQIFTSLMMIDKIIQIKMTVSIVIDSVNITVTKRAGSTEHLFAGNSLLITALLNECADSLGDPLRLLYALDLKCRSRLISCAENNGADAEDLLSEGLLERNIENSVEQDLFTLDVEQTCLQIELGLAETVYRKGDRKTNISLPVLPDYILFFSKSSKLIDLSHNIFLQEKSYISYNKDYFTAYNDK